jgi:hypothetical protein
MPKKIDYTNAQFGRLTVLRYSHREKSRPFWICRCNCGKETVKAAALLQTGRVNSCGCLYDETRTTVSTHGQYKSKAYSSWQHMRDRCTNPKYTSYKNYGAKGISVCERWQRFESFIEDMGQPNLGESIDRIDSTGNYEPSNCKWSTASEQMRNTSRTRVFSFNGKTQCAEDWARELGLSRGQLVTWRIDNGWSLEKALTTRGRNA